MKQPLSPLSSPMSMPIRSACWKTWNHGMTQQNLGTYWNGVVGLVQECPRGINFKMNSRRNYITCFHMRLGREHQQPSRVRSDQTGSSRSAQLMHPLNATVCFALLELPELSILVHHSPSSVVTSSKNCWNNCNLALKASSSVKR